MLISSLGGGIGRACALAFAKHGALGVMIADIDTEAAQNSVNESRSVSSNPGFRAEACQVDVTTEDSVKLATEKMVQAFGRIDYCVNSAGVSTLFVSLERYTLGIVTRFPVGT